MNPILYYGMDSGVKIHIYICGGDSSLMVHKYINGADSGLMIHIYICGMGSGAGMQEHFILWCESSKSIIYY